jgi:hypothetical protein
MSSVASGASKVAKGVARATADVATPGGYEAARAVSSEKHALSQQEQDLQDQANADATAASQAPQAMAARTDLSPGDTESAAAITQTGDTPYAGTSILKKRAASRALVSG